MQGTATYFLCSGAEWVLKHISAVAVKVASCTQSNCASSMSVRQKRRAHFGVLYIDCFATRIVRSSRGHACSLGDLPCAQNWITCLLRGCLARLCAAYVIVHRLLRAAPLRCQRNNVGTDRTATARSAARGRAMPLRWRASCCCVVEIDDATLIGCC